MNDIDERTPDRTSLLTPRRDGPASRLATHTRSPVLAWGATTVVGLVTMMAVMIGLGLLLVAEFLPEGVGAWDRSINTWFVAQSTATLDSVTAVGSMLGSTFVVVGIAVLVGIALAIARKWQAIGLLAAGLLIEVGAFLATTLVISRPRPAVRHLDAAPPTSSFPSGHTAAALVLYVSIAIIIWTLTDARWVRAIFLVAAVVTPIFVGLSRLYRGMHHPTDVLASVLLAAGALVFAVAAVRVGTAVASARHDRSAPASEPSYATRGVSV